MQQIWKRIEAWLTKHQAFPILSSLAPGADEESLQALEAEFGVPLPDDVRLSYSIHDGQCDGLGIPDRFIFGDQLYSLSKMLLRWRVLKGLGGELSPVKSIGPVQPVRDSPERLPIASDDGSHYYFLDFAPTQGGTRGQVILSFHDEPTLRCIAPSFKAWMGMFADQLEEGKYVYVPKIRGLLPVEGVEELGDA